MIDLGLERERAAADAGRIASTAMISLVEGAVSDETCADLLDALALELRTALGFVSRQARSAAIGVIVEFIGWCCAHHAPRSADCGAALVVVLMTPPDLGGGQ